MQTKLLTDNFMDAAEILSKGGIVAVPTETVYGLAGNGLDCKAVSDIYEVKGRPAIKPLSLMVPGIEAIGEYCVNVPVQAYHLAKAFWPGPLTIVLTSKDIVPQITRAGGKTIGLRCPQSIKTLALLRVLSFPLAAPSANLSGCPSPKRIEEVLSYFDGKIEAVIDGGECGLGFESTIIDMSSKPFRILRQGALPEEKIVSTLRTELNIVGITGCTGSGKSTASEYLKTKDYLVIDCDVVYHKLLSDNSCMKQELASSFPEALSSDGINTKILGKIVYNHPELLAKLNNITHKYVVAEVNRIIDEYAMNGGINVAIDAVELISSGLSNICNRVYGIISDKETRTGRIMLRDSISRDYATGRICAQKDSTYYSGLCDVIIENDSTLEAFYSKLDIYFGG